MFKGISWGAFLAVVLVSVLIYYLILAILYRKTLIAWFTKRLGGEKKSGEEAGEKEEEGISEDEQRQAEEALNELEVKIAQLRKVLAEAGKGADKQALLKRIADAMANYDGLHRPAFRHALNNFICQYTEEFCDLVIQEEELEELWNQE
ncbi:MAG: hypothetical protein P0Y53_01260 [Candidatus Pseudobacter hemicellulosilyticus]|uniref:Uncharacterized protein n=1 Tax=Candidatus Pseudobacter hemicellulosilyticus TaxID=3121375 RepID=A0AAJ5WST2_9BACT|nr:MAG: hypothetical protein P0Y53_01260 [Pseudobacter sp.]